MYDLQRHCAQPHKRFTLLGLSPLGVVHSSHNNTVTLPQTVSVLSQHSCFYSATAAHVHTACILCAHHASNRAELQFGR